MLLSSVGSICEIGILNDVRHPRNFLNINKMAYSFKITHEIFNQKFGRKLLHKICLQNILNLKIQKFKENLDFLWFVDLFVK